MTTALPENVHYGTVTGQFIASVADSYDDDVLPDSKPMGGQVIFTPSVPYVKNTSTTPNPLTIVKTAITAVIDEEGYLCTQSISSTTGKYVRGVQLVATDDPNLNPVGWVWNVEYKMTLDGRAVSGPAKHSIEVPMGSTVDLTDVSPVASSAGNAIVKGDKGDPAITTVQHGTDGSVARPETVGLVYWVGTERPLNAQPFDMWYSV